MDSPREPVPSLGDAAALLLRSAAAQLRRSLPRPRQPVAPGSPVAPARLPAARRRSVVSRHVLTCAALLLVIVGSTAALTWWSWQALQDRQVELGGERDLQSASADDRSLLDDLVKREDAGLEAPAPAAGRGPAVLERSTPQLPAPAGTSISLDGRIVAGAVIAIAVVAASGASWLVVRHFRRKAAAALPVGNDARAWLDNLPDLEPVGPDEPEAAPVAEEEPAAAPEQSECPGVDEQVAALLVEQRTDTPADPVALTPEPTRPTGGIALDPAEAPGNAAWAAEPAAAGSGTTTALKAPVAPEARAYDDLAADAAARERIFDRRVSRRVPYIKSAWLWWAELNAPVTIQDLSLTGLRCLLGQPAGAAAPVAPALADQVRVFFPVNGSTIKAGARVQWREHTPQGIQMGLEFVDLPSDDLAAVRQLLVEAED